MSKICANGTILLTNFLQLCIILLDITARTAQQGGHHNRQHAQELHELAHSVDGEAAQLLHEAVVDLTVSSEKLAEALRILKGEE